MAFGFGQIFSPLNRAHPQRSAEIQSGSLDQQWDRWASQGSFNENRDFAVRRLRQCMASGSPVLDLSHLGLESLPQALPGHITELIVSGNKLTRLPDALPAELLELDVSDNSGLKLSRIPDGLTSLHASGCGLRKLPQLPMSLGVCDVSNNELKELPQLSPWLDVLKAAGNRIRKLPDLPPTLKSCDVSGNKLVKLPPLPGVMENLNVSKNRLMTLPILPRRLLKMDVAFNDLRRLPALPEGIKELVARKNKLEKLTNVPASLTRIDISANRFKTFSDVFIERLSRIQSIDVYDNPMRHSIVQRLINFLPAADATEVPINAAHHGSADARPIRNAVMDWFPAGRREEVGAQWSELSDQARDAQAFSAFLDRLSEVKFVKNTPEFRSTVARWLTSLAQDHALRDDSMRVCYDATQTCEDRVALKWNGLQRLALSHAISNATADTPKENLIQWSREVYALTLLEEIAMDKVDAVLPTFKKRYPNLSEDRLRGLIDEVEIHLSYSSRLADRLGLQTPIRDMRFTGAYKVTSADLDDAFKRVSSALESAKFGVWRNNWEPWQTFLDTLYHEELELAKERRAEVYSDPALTEAAMDEMKSRSGVRTDKEADDLLAAYLTDTHFEPLTKRALQSSASSAPSPLSAQGARQGIAR